MLHHRAIHVAAAVVVLFTACGRASTRSLKATEDASVAIQPRTADLQVGGVQQFTAVVAGTISTLVDWSVVEGSCGTVSAGGSYTAPGSPATCHVTVKSQATPSAQATATVNVTAAPPLAVTISPRTASIPVGSTLNFAAVVTGTTDAAVTWAVSEASACGSINDAGLYTAPAAPTTCHVVVTLHADGTKSDTATVTVRAAGSSPQNVIGLNASTPLYYDTGKMYANALRSGVFQNAGTSVDSNGWPLVASFNIVAEINRYNEGRWVIYWDGTASVSNVSGTWDGVIGGPGGTGPDGLPLGANTRYINVDVGASSGLSLSFTNAARNNGSGLAGLTNVMAMRPVSQGGTSAHRRDETISRSLKAEVAKGVSVFRYMDFLGTNSSQVRTWGGRPWRPNTPYALGDKVTMCRGADATDSCGRVFTVTVAGTSGPAASGGPETATIGATIVDNASPSSPRLTWRYEGYGRPLPTWSGFSRASDVDGFTFSGVGGPYEDIIKFSNEAGVDPWICIPHLVDDDYFTKLGLLFKWGSDGALPYTGPYGSGGTNPQPQSGPLFPPLNADRNLYVEYSNELWLWTFPQSVWITATAAADGELDYNGDTTNLWNRYLARQLVKISNGLRAAFGDTEMPYTGTGRIRPMMMGQHGSPDQTFGESLKFVHEYFGDGDGKDHSASRTAHGFGSAAHPVNYYVWGVGGAPYWASSGSTVAQQLDSISAAAVHNDRPARFAKSFGVKLATYEGGPELPRGALGTQTNMTDRPASPNMRDLVIDNYNDWIRSGGDLAVYYIHSWMGNASLNWVWVYDDGAGGNPWNLASPKMNAVQEIAGQQRVPVVLGSTGLSTGAAIPGTLPGGKYSIWWSNGTWVPDPPGTGSVALSASHAWQNMAGYVFLASDSASRSISASVSGGGTVAAFIDGVRIGSGTASGTVSFGSVPLVPGLHGVMLVATAGTVNVASVSVE